MIRKGLFHEDSFQIYGSDCQYGTYSHDQFEFSEHQFEENSCDQQENEADDANKTTESLGGGEKKKNNKKQVQHQPDQVQKRIIKMYPGETKNLPKNLCRAMKGFLDSIFTSSQIQQNSALRSFMNKSKQKCGKEDLDHFLGTGIGRQIGNMFYGNLKFTGFFVKENKVNLDSYFRILDEYFLPNKEIEP